MNILNTQGEKKVFFSEFVDAVAAFGVAGSDTAVG